MNTALVGYTGFVGTTLRRQTSFAAHFNSKNIADIRAKQYDLLICAGAPAAKWKANQDPQGDIANLRMLMSHLEHVETEQFVLISTIDVYPTPVGVDETTEFDSTSHHAYGKNRFTLEEFVREHFEAYTIIRLPGLFGEGLRKNFLYDLLHTGESPWTHSDSIFQFYNMGNLWRDIQTAVAGNPGTINFATEPVRAADVAQRSFGINYTFETETPPARYDMRTIHANLFDATPPYIASADEIYTQIREFAMTEASRSESDEA